MIILKASIFLSFVYFSQQQITGWSGNFCGTIVQKTNYTEVCKTPGLFWCIEPINITQQYNDTEYSCCTGWTHNGDKNCSIPICLSSCKNGGTCISPNTCKCKAGYQGSTCETVSLCSHLLPCYPGACSGSPTQCVCSNGFSGSSCLQLAASYAPTLHRSNATLTYVNSTISTNQYKVDSTVSSNITWSNFKDYNLLKFEISSSFDVMATIGSIPALPTYIKNATFGIVSGTVGFTYITSTATSGTVLDCSDVGKSNPVQVLRCNIQITNTLRVASGDIFTLAFSTKSGGKRDLLNTDDNSVYGEEFYIGPTASNVLQYRFDFEVPAHCIQSSACTDNPMKMEQDVTMISIRPYWSGWRDNLSGVFRYSFEVWKLEYVASEDGLREPLITSSINPKPLYITDTLADALSFPEYKPTEPGVYSCILEVNDKANNSEYVRRIVVYDDTSDVTVNSSKRLYISSATADTNYIWQTNYQSDGITIIQVIWEGLFANHFHKDQHFLSKVLDYQARLSDNVQRYNYKRILPVFDDKEGNRSVNAIPHIRGIVKFEMAHEIISKPKAEPPDIGWINTASLLESSSFQMASRTIGDGDSHQVWIRASDIRNVNKSETTVIHFDQTGPENFLTSVDFNIHSGTSPFTSRINIITQDLHSGVVNSSFKLVLNETGEVKYSTDVVIVNLTKENCAKTPDCYCIPMGLCFLRTVSILVNNCQLGVPLELVDSGTYFLYISSYNAARLSTVSSFQIGKVISFAGIDRYPSPSSISFVNKTNEKVAIQWTNVQTCYHILRFIIKLHKPNNSTETFTIGNGTSIYTIANLSPGDSYTIEMYTEYGTNSYVARSLLPLNVTFMTAPFCSHLLPCYPGYCSSESDNCTCSPGFSGNSCLLFDAKYMPKLLPRYSTLSYHDSTTGKDLYSYKVNSTDSSRNNLTWSNQQDFNFIQFILKASFDQAATLGLLPVFPNYINGALFGIVEGKVYMKHITASSGTSSTILQCDNASNSHPVDELQCYITNGNPIKVSSGDILSLIFSATSGGYRELMKINSGLVTGTENYSGITVEDALDFRFDLDVPLHCKQTSNCSDNPMKLERDITSTAIRPFWSGWTDKISSVYKYSFEVWKLEYIESEDGLREPIITNLTNPVPLYISEIAAKDLVAYPKYTPTGPGVYSCILEINDMANNSEYVRRITIYDNASKININASNRLYVSSANVFTNYLWQTDFTTVGVTDVRVQWRGVFQNIVHKDGHFLSKVLDYQPRLSDNGRRHNYKRILPIFDDNEGDRTTKGIPQINGIIKFEINHEKVTAKSPAPISGWTEITPLAENTSFNIASGAVNDGDVQQIWIRAVDAMNQSMTETSLVYFDQSAPEIFLTKVEYNINGGAYTFTSRFTITSQDLHSGVLNISVQFVLNQTNEIKYQKEITVQMKTAGVCSTISGCYCTPMSTCFVGIYVFDINNCVLGVPIELIRNGSYVLRVTSFNNAMLVRSTVFKLTDLSNISGIGQYASPSSLQEVNVTNTDITIQWLNIPTCYERLRLIIYLHKSDNTTVDFVTDKDVTSLTFAGLYPGETYKVELYTEFGNVTQFVRSLEPSLGTFTTAAYCSHLKPCFPGHCKNYVDECICTNGFTGSSCQYFDAKYMPQLHRRNSTMSYQDTSTGKDLYSYTFSSSESSRNNLTWSNQEDFNIIQFVLEASFDQAATIGSLPTLPNYINGALFGIVEGKVKMTHISALSGVNTSIFQCVNASNLHPVQELHCYLTIGNPLKVSSGDIISLTFNATSGGYRVLQKINSGLVTGTEYYIGATIVDVLDFRFDLDVPVHCKLTSNCTDNPMKLERDITTTAIRPFWSGWTDKLSSVYRYSFEVWKLEYVESEGGLREPIITNLTNPVPLYISDVVKDSVAYTEYTPTVPGVYSCILEVSDLANNSEYVRRITIYDNASKISVNASNRLYVSSANVFTNYLWQTDYTTVGVTNVKVQWQGVFQNIVHKDGHFLYKVLDYQPRLSDNGRRHNYKRILPIFDDIEGDRTTKAIPNINGIIQFEINHEKVTAQSPAPITGWTKISPLAENTSFNIASGAVNDGDVQQIWIRAVDVMNQSMTETSLVYFDQSAPEIVLTKVEYNINGGAYTFTSRFTITCQDLHSGVLNISVQFVLNQTNEIKYQKEITVQMKTAGECAMIPGCYCTPMSTCFVGTYVFDINNCVLGVPIELIRNGSYVLRVTSYNKAMLMRSTVFKLTDLSNIAGIGQYASPSSIQLVNVTNTDITIQWLNNPTCYERLRVVIYLHKPENKTDAFETDRDVTSFYFAGLFPGETYKVEMYTEFGNTTIRVRSLEPSYGTFITAAYCTHLKPCFPGHCKNYVDECICTNGFSGASCQNLNLNYIPKITSSSVLLGFVEARVDKYSYNVSSRSSSNTTWSNQGDYNILMLGLEASFDINSTIGPLPSLHNYVKSVAFGIVKGVVTTEYTNLNSGKNTTTKQCKDVSLTHPVLQLDCNIEVMDSMTVQSGDIFNVKFVTEAGGYRELINIGNGSTAGIEYYQGSATQQSFEYKFDLDVPIHCIQTASCTLNPMRLDKDVTMTSIRPYWSGWTDIHSGVYRYSFEVWKMEYIQIEDGLREPVITNNTNPKPLYITGIMATNSINFPEYTPTESGVYSCILEINDKANNSEYVRRVVIYDVTSDVTINTTQRLLIPSAVPETNYLWQTNYTLDGVTKIAVTWGNLFANMFHVQGHFLSKILKYGPRLSDNIKRLNYKRILPIFDDNEGDRRIDPIPNINGIVRFEMNYQKVSRLQTKPPDSGWLVISGLTLNTSFNVDSSTMVDGDSIQMWIRAYDVVNHSKTETSIIHFDNSGPVIHLSNVAYDVIGSHQFTSRFTVITRDYHSGAKNVSFQLILNGTTESRYETNIIVVQKSSADCARIPDCYCVVSGNCFMQNVVFDINNCLLGVPIGEIDDGIYILNVKSYNMAILSTTEQFELRVKDFKGINEYPSPSAVTFLNKTDTQVTIQWKIIPTCYERVGFFIHVYRQNNISRIYEIGTNLTYFTMTDLSPGVTYNLEMYTIYENSMRSLEPLNVTFDTSESVVPPADELNLAAIIAPSIGGLIFLTALAIIIIYKLEKRRRQNLRKMSIAPSPDIRSEVKVPIIQRTPTLTRKLTGGLLSIPDRPSLEKETEKLKTNIFDISLPKGRANTLPPLPPLSSQMNGQIKN